MSTDGDDGSIHTRCVLLTLNTASGAFGNVYVFIVSEASNALCTRAIHKLTSSFKIKL